MSERVVVDLADWIEQRAEKGSLFIKLREGEPVRLLPPELWSDETIEALNAPGTTIIERGRAVLGPDEYARFVAGGGSAKMLDALIAERHELLAPESPASSHS